MLAVCGRVMTSLSESALEALLNGLDDPGVMYDPGVNRPAASQAGPPARADDADPDPFGDLAFSPVGPVVRVIAPQITLNPPPSKRVKVDWYPVLLSSEKLGPPAKIDELR